MADNVVNEIAIVKGPEEIGVEGKCGEAVAEMARQGRIVRVVGQIIDGRVVIDQASLDEIAARFPGANMSFVAVNAPFDPTHSVSLA
jgi:hypothetical protein